MCMHERFSGQNSFKGGGGGGGECETREECIFPKKSESVILAIIVHEKP